MLEEVESSASAMRSDIPAVRIRAFKSTPRSAWKMGLDLRYVNRGIRIFQFYFRSHLRLEWLLSFCFFCGVLGFGGYLRFGSHDLADWRKGVFVKPCAADRGGLENDQREKDSGLQSPAAVSPVSPGMEKASSPTVMAKFFSLVPSSVEHACVFQWSSEAKNRVWTFNCFPLWPKEFPIRIPLVISLLLMCPPLEPRKETSKILIYKLRNLAWLSGLRRVVGICL